MTFYRSTSISKLILIGFSLVTLPLLIALITALVSVDRLTTQSRQAVYEAAHAIQSNQLMVEDLTAMERSARQYQVLGDRTLYNVYLERHQDFQQKATELGQHKLNGPQRGQLNDLVRQEGAVFAALRDAPPGSDQAKAAISNFPALDNLARAILSESSQMIGREVDHMQAASIQARRLLIGQALALVPAALVLALVFTVLITRPIRQLNQAIRQLGAGQFGTAIGITGPQDLEDLGKRLDWLRVRLMELEQQKIAFLRHMSHELKTPLATIREGSELLTDGVAGQLEPEQAEIAQIMRKNSLQLQKLIEDLLGFSVAQAPTPFLDERPVQLHHLLEGLIEDHKLAARARHIRFDMDLAEATVTGDQEKLKTIFDNLLSNAVKYSPSGGTVRITLRRGDGHAMVDVCDDGPGIDAGERERIFEAFYQGHARSGGHVKGSGLGLSIAQEYVRSHGGTIAALAAQRGARLHVELPLVGVRERQE